MNPSSTAPAPAPKGLPPAVINLLTIIGALLYVVSPCDLLPDFVPALGWCDDIAVLLSAVGFVLARLASRPQPSDSVTPVGTQVLHLPAAEPKQ